MLSAASQQRAPPPTPTQGSKSSRDWYGLILWMTVTTVFLSYDKKETDTHIFDLYVIF